MQLFPFSLYLIGIFAHSFSAEKNIFFSVGFVASDFASRFISGRFFMPPAANLIRLINRIEESANPRRSAIKVEETAILNYLTYLENEGRSADTVRKYGLSLRGFAGFLSGREATEKLAEEYLRKLIRKHSPGRANTAVSALNGYFEFTGERIKLSQFKAPATVPEPLTANECLRLFGTARILGDERLALIIETICSTGLRVSELQSVTVEHVSRGAIGLSGTKTVLFPKALREKLLAYAKQNGIKSGQIFITRLGRGPHRGTVWRELQALCKHAGVDAQRATPECMRRLYTAQMTEQMTDRALNLKGFGE